MTSVLVALGVLVAGCSRDGFTDRTAVVTVDGEATTYTIDSCGLDGQTVFIVGRTADRSVLQAVVELEADGSAGVPAATGITFGPAYAPEAAFGATAWDRRAGVGRAPGRVASSDLRGSRIRISGDAERIDGSDRVVEPSSSETFSLQARCDDLES